MTDMTDTCILIPPPVIGIKSGLNGICHYGGYIGTSVISVTSVTSVPAQGKERLTTNHPAGNHPQNTPHPIETDSGGRVAGGHGRLMRVSKWARRMAQDKSNSEINGIRCITFARKMGEKWAVLNENYRYIDTSDDLKTVFEGVLFLIINNYQQPLSLNKG
jgi:hypothetical protein